MYNITRANTIIGKQFDRSVESVYRDSPVGKLEKTDLVRSMFIPLHQGFGSNCEACFSIAVDNLSATATFIDCVVAGMSTLFHSTAVGTPFGGVVGIYNYELDVLVKTSVLKDFSESIEWHTEYLPIETFSFGIELPEFLYSNISIILDSNVRYVSDNLSEPVLDKIMFPALEHSKFAACSLNLVSGKPLENPFAIHKLFALHPNIFPRIKLFQDFAFRTQNADSEALAVDIYANHVFTAGDFLFLGEIGNNLTITNQPIGFTSPPIFEQVGVPLEVPVFFDWNSNMTSFPPAVIETEPNKELGFCPENLTASWNIELDNNRIQLCSLGFDNRTLYITNNLTLEGGLFHGT